MDRYNLYQVSQSLFGYAFYLTNSYHDAQDLVQDAVLKILTNPSFKPESEKHLKNTIAVGIKQIFLDNIRKASSYKRKKPTGELPERITYPDVFAVMLNKELNKALRVLTGKQKTILKLHVEGYKNPEIAKITGEKRDNNINCNLLYARKKLKPLFI